MLYAEDGEDFQLPKKVFAEIQIAIDETVLEAWEDDKQSLNCKFHWHEMDTLV